MARGCLAALIAWTLPSNAISEARPLLEWDVPTVVSFIERTGCEHAARVARDRALDGPAFLATMSSEDFHLSSYCLRELLADLYVLTHRLPRPHSMTGTPGHIPDRPKVRLHLDAHAHLCRQTHTCTHEQANAHM